MNAVESWTTSEVGARAGVTAECVRLWAEAGRLPIAMKLPGGRRVFHRRDVEVFLR